MRKERVRAVTFDRLKLINEQARKGISCSDLARTLGVDRAYISHWRSGKNAPAMKYRIELSKAFKVPLSFWNI